MFILISGVSGSGKTELINYALEKISSLEMPKAVITRKRRTTDNVNIYTFVTKEEFSKFISSNSLLEYQLYSGNYYGILKQSYQEIINRGNIAIREIAFEGIQNIRHIIDETVNIYIDADFEKIYQRMFQRGDSLEDIQTRTQDLLQETKKLRKIADIIFENNLPFEYSKEAFVKLIKSLL